MGIIFVALLVAAAVALIIFLKNSSTRSLDVDGYFRTPADTVVATPSVGGDTLAQDNATEIVVPDTILGTDARDVSDAGYEDGYWAGYDDAHLGDERASYDESSNFPSPADRRKYTVSYRAGYQDGWQTGLNDREAMDKADENKKLPQ